MSKPNPVDIGNDELVPLSKAGDLFFHGWLTKSSLRTEAKKGNLEIIRIAGRDFVTRSGINRMIEKCRRNENQQDFGSGPTPELGSSRTGTAGSAQNALKMMLQERKQGSRNTSQRNTSRSAEVVRLK